jgi:hypothetical protein
VKSYVIFFPPERDFKELFWAFSKNSGIITHTDSPYSHSLLPLFFDATMVCAYLC